MGVSKKLEVQLKLSLRYIIQKKDRHGNEYVDKAMISDTQGMPFYGLQRKNDTIKEMSIEDMEPYCASATYLFQVFSQRATEDLKEFEQLNHITLGLKDNKNEKYEMTITKESKYLFISLYKARK